MDKVSFPYRSGSHLMFLHVVAESGAWEKHGLDVSYDFQISKSDAHRAMDAGEVEFVGGNHISAYGARARGDDWVYLAQSVNEYRTKLCVRPDSGIEGLSDLKGKKVATSGNHPSLNDWLFLRQHGLDVDSGDIEMVKRVSGTISVNAQPEGAEDPNAPKPKRVPHWHWIRDGAVDAALLPAPASLFAEAAGLKLIDIETMPMIWFTTVSSNTRFVQRHPNLVERFLKGLIEGVHFYKTQRERSIKVIQERCLKDGPMTYEQAAYCWENTASNLDPRLFPSLPAILNVYEEAKRQDKDSNLVNPLSLWDTHHVRRIDDMGFVDDLYRADAGPDAKHAGDPDFLKDKAKEAARVIASVKACGHSHNEDCDCD